MTWAGPRALTGWSNLKNFVLFSTAHVPNRRV